MTKEYNTDKALDDFLLKKETQDPNWAKKPLTIGDLNPGIENMPYSTWLQQIRLTTEQSLGILADVDLKKAMECINILKQQIETLHIDIECRKQHIAELQTERQADHATIEASAQFSSIAAWKIEALKAEIVTLKEEYIKKLEFKIDKMNGYSSGTEEIVREMIPYTDKEYAATYAWQDAASNWHRSTPSPIQSKPTSLLGIGVLAGLGALLTATSKPTDVRVPETDEDASNEPIEAANNKETHQ